MWISRVRAPISLDSISCSKPGRRCWRRPICRSNRFCDCCPKERRAQTPNTTQAGTKPAWVWRSRSKSRKKDEVRDRGSPQGFNKMKATGNILQRYSNLPKTKVVGGVGQESRLPWRNQASQARRLRYTGRAPSYASWFQVTLNRVVAISTPNRIWNG